MRQITALALREMKQAGDSIAMLTAYDYPFAQLADAAGVDAVLVGDSCATTVMGLSNTLGIGMDAMVHHTAMVSRAVRRALVIADMPFLSYHTNTADAVRNAGRLMTEGGAHAVKLEGGIQRTGNAIRAILRAGIPVMGHLGLTPQSIHQIGGYKLQGKDELSRDAIKSEARDLEQTGCFSLVLEKVPENLAKEITDVLAVPTIGIGAGRYCDGQVLVMHDVLGMGIKARHVKVFADAGTLVRGAFAEYVQQVKDHAFPGEEHGY